MFLALVQEANGTYLIRTVHRVQRYLDHPVTPSPWDGRVFAFEGGVLPGNHIDLVAFPNNAFEFCDVATVSTLVQAAAILAAQPNLPQILPLAQGAADTQDVRVR